MIPLGEWIPDHPDYGTHATIAKNVIAENSSIPGGTSYRPFPSLAVYSNALNGLCQGAIAVKGTSGTPSNFAGTADKLYLLSGATYSNVSIAAEYDGTAESRWHYTIYGNRVIATNYDNYPQSYVIGTSSLFANLTTAFKSKYVANVRDFVFHGYINDGTAKQNMVWWSAINDPTDYTVSPSTQCDNQLIYGEGEQGDITGIVGGEYATVFMEGGIHRFTYTGGSVIFTRDQIVYGAGCVAPGSIASYGGFIFYLGPDGFYLLNGTTVIPIGKNKVDKWFFTDLDQDAMHLISSTIDPINSLYIMAYPGSGNSGTCNRMIMYNWVSQKWSYVEPGNIDVLVLSMSTNVDFDSAGSATIYDYPDTSWVADVMLDSRIFVGGKVQLSAFNSDHKLCHFNASALEAVVETAETRITAPMRALVTNVTPHVENYGSITIEMGTRETHDDTVSYADAVTVNSNGEANVLSNARYHRGRLTITGGFDHAYGIDVEATRAGRY